MRSVAGATGLGMQVAPGQAGLGLQAQWSVTQFNVTQLRLAQGWLPSGWREEASAVSGPHARGRNAAVGDGHSVPPDRTQCPPG